MPFSRVSSVFLSGARLARVVGRLLALFLLGAGSGGGGGAVAAASRSRSRLPALPLLPPLRSRKQLGLVVVDIAVERRDLAVGHHPELVGDQLHQMRVVAHQHDGAVEVVDGVDQRGARIHVEVVGRLVEQQQVRGVARGQRQQQPRLLAARQQADLEVGTVARKAEAAELGAHLGLARRWPQRARHVVEGRGLVVEAFFLVLREVADAQLRRLPDPAFARLQAVRQQPDERRLAGAVDAEEADPVVDIEAQVELLRIGGPSP